MLRCWLTVMCSSSPDCRLILLNVMRTFIANTQIVHNKIVRVDDARGLVPKALCAMPCQCVHFARTPYIQFMHEYIKPKSVQLQRGGENESGGSSSAGVRLAQLVARLGGFALAELSV